MTHRIKFTLHESGIHAEFTCDAPVGTQCRLTCPDGCEEWDYIDHEHKLIDYGKCLYLDYFEALDEEVWLMFSGEEGTELRSGEVEVTYEGDGIVTWEYPEPKTGFLGLELGMIAGVDFGKVPDVLARNWAERGQE
jgi:hypothetical protein